MYDVIIVGGGLAGLITAIEFSRNKKRILLIEKKQYPFHKVCGEYVSNEVLPYLRSLGFEPFDYGASDIKRLRISTPGGKNIYTSLDMGGFGLSRYTMDAALYKLAMQTGVEVLTGKVTAINFEEQHFTVTTTDEIFTAKLVVGAYGKRDTLDKKLNRPFITRRTGYLGVKYHVRTDYPADEIGLDNFKNGYCGIVKIEDDKYNLCYLYHKPYTSPKSIEELEEEVLFENPVLKNIFKNSEFVFEKPVAINEISFAPKHAVEQHILMCGDAAGLITPLCGNGMSMAISAAKTLSALVIKSGMLEAASVSEGQRNRLESAYQKQWDTDFKTRLLWGRTIQRFFGSPALTGLFIQTMHKIPILERKLLSYTHGRELTL